MLHGVKLTLVSALAVVPATLPALAVHAEVGQGYPGGCIVAVAATAPSSCTYVSIGGEPVRVSFAGTGTVSLSGCTAGSLPPAPAGTYVTTVQSPGCTYTLAVSGSGIALAENQGPANFAECSDFSDGFVLGDFSDCFYDATGSSGQATGVAVSSLPAEVDITVKDLSSGGGSVGSYKTTGTGVIDVTCTYAEVLGHQYEVTGNDPTFNDVLMAIVGEG